MDCAEKATSIEPKPRKMKSLRMLSKARNPGLVGTNHEQHPCIVVVRGMKNRHCNPFIAHRCAVRYACSTTIPRIVVMDGDLRGSAVWISFVGPESLPAFGPQEIFAMTVNYQTTPPVPRHDNLHGINCCQGGPELVRQVWSMRPKKKSKHTRRFSCTRLFCCM